MTNELKRIVLAAGLATACLAGLSACGGGSDNDTTVSEMQREDQAASSSVTGLVGLANAMLSLFTTDAHEPRAMDGVTPAVSDADEPVAL